MELWVVAEANNIDYNISMSPGFDTEEDAKRYLKEMYELCVNGIGEENVEESDISNKTYRVMESGSDNLFYGEIHKITI